MEIVENEHQRPAGRRADEERGGRIEEREARVLGLEGRRERGGRQIGPLLPDLGHNLRDTAGPRSHLRGQYLRVGAA